MGGLLICLIFYDSYKLYARCMSQLQPLCKSVHEIGLSNELRPFGGKILQYQAKLEATLKYIGTSD